MESLRLASDIVRSSIMKIDSKIRTCQMSEKGKSNSRMLVKYIRMGPKRNRVSPKKDDTNKDSTSFSRMICLDKRRDVDNTHCIEVVLSFELLCPFCHFQSQLIHLGGGEFQEQEDQQATGNPEKRRQIHSNRNFSDELAPTTTVGLFDESIMFSDIPQALFRLGKGAFACRRTRIVPETAFIRALGALAGRPPPSPQRPPTISSGVVVMLAPVPVA
jgi:hypothetical protein